MELNKLFKPMSIALIGAAREEGKVGHLIFEHILGSNYKGKIYPINPKANEIHGIKCYPSVRDVPERLVELAVLVIPAQYVSAAVDDCGIKEVSFVVIISAGFKETGPEGLKLEREIIAKAKSYGMRILGPNCLGFIDTTTPLDASFAKTSAVPGNISFVSQSGALCSAILDYAKPEGIGFAKFVSLGNKADINEIDLLKEWSADADTRVIGIYMEGLNDGRRFVEVAKETSMIKPIITVKSGITQAGAKAASSHTGTLAGSQHAYDAAFKQSGIVHARSIQDMFDYCVAFSYQNLPSSNRVALITNAGGPGIMAADACEKLGIRLASFTRENLTKLESNLPKAANIYNPIDILGDAKADRYRFALEVALADKNVDSVIVILTPQAPTEAKETAIAISEISRTSSKTVIACFMGKDDIAEGVKFLNSNKIPNYYFPERAVEALNVMIKYEEFRRKDKGRYKKFNADHDSVKKIFEASNRIGRINISEADSKDVLAAYGIRTPKHFLAKTSNEAVEAARRFGFPVVMKIASPDILHKSDIGGIKVGLQDEVEVKEAYKQIIWNSTKFMPDAVIWGVSIQEMISDRKEVIVGVNKDSQFGPMVMFGLGGIYVEVLKDVSFRIAPLTDVDASEMITEINSFPLLVGVRGQKRADIESITDILLRVSNLVMDFPEINEMDINPLMVGTAGEGSVAVDARISLGGK